jgi:hypothetical protein
MGFRVADVELAERKGVQFERFKIEKGIGSLINEWML